MNSNLLLKPNLPIEKGWKKSINKKTQVADTVIATPRTPSEIIRDEAGNRKVVNKNGEDVTTEFIKGAMKTVSIAKIVEADQAIMKKNSPSCGYGKIYDGTFSNNLVEGNGITVDLLIENGIEILTVDDLD